MNLQDWRRGRFGLAGLAVMLAAASVVVAGPPLICHAFDIGDAKSLPFVSHDWNLSGGEGYSTQYLAQDTIAILDLSRATLVHMETLRRATLYARKDRQAAKQLLMRLTARAEASENSTRPDALAIFDAGYLAETYKQWLGDGGENPAQGINGYARVKKALELSGGDPEIEFAAAVMTIHGPDAERRQHAAKAIAGAKADALLLRNLQSHFLGQSETMAEMISRGPETKAARE